MKKPVRQLAPWANITLPDVLERAAQDYVDWADKYLKALERRTVIRKPLYHYTDASGLKGIIENDEIWFTDYHYLNDPSELRHGIFLAHATIKAARLNAGHAETLCDMMTDLFAHDNFDSQLQFLIACFSRDGDELGQWRAYADNGRGFAIKFSKRMFGSNDPVSANPLMNVTVGPVLYRDAVTKRLHALAIRKAISGLQMATQYAPKHLNQNDIFLGFSDRLAKEALASPMIWNCLTCKHPAYARENEVRLIILGTKETFKGKLPVRIRKGEVVPYYNRPMGLRKPGNILEVMVGPAAPIGAEDGVRTLLDKYNINARISRSKIPYRPV
jgi:hypothetical protein